MMLNVLKLTVAAAAAFALNGAIAHASTIDQQVAVQTADQPINAEMAPNCRAGMAQDQAACQAREACTTTGVQDPTCQSYCAEFSTDGVCQSISTEALWPGWGRRGWCRWHPYAPRCRW